MFVKLLQITEFSVWSLNQWPLIYLKNCRINLTMKQCVIRFEFSVLLCSIFGHYFLNWCDSNFSINKYVYEQINREKLGHHKHMSIKSKYRNLDNMLIKHTIRAEFLKLYLMSFNLIEITINTEIHNCEASRDFSVQ